MIPKRSQIRSRLHQLSRDLISVFSPSQKDGSLRTFLIQGASWSFILRVASTALTFLTTVILARLLGAEGYGIYAYVLSLVGLLNVIANFGLPQLLVRNVAAYRARAEWSLLRGLLTRANQIAWFLSLALAVVSAIVAIYGLPPGDQTLLSAFLIALLILPLRVINTLRSSTLRGLRHVVLGQLPDTVIVPVTFLLLTGLAYGLIGGSFSAPWAVGALAAANALGLAVGIVLLVNRLPSEVKDVEPTTDMQSWVRSAIPFLLIGGMQLIIKNADIAMVGALSGAEDAGIYKVATRGADLVAFVLMAANFALQPEVSRLYASGNMERLQQLSTRSARMILAGSLPIAMILILFGPWILRVFGPEFPRGATSLTILCIGRVFSAGMGSVSLILSMTGHERDAARGVVIAALVNVLLNVLLIPLLGIEGAATATAISLAVWNVILGIQIIRRLGIAPSIFARGHSDSTAS